MDPFFARNRLSSYLDGTLSDAEAAEVSEAIEADPSLREEYEALRRAVNFIKRVGPAEAPADFKDKVMAKVATEATPGGKLVWLFRPLARIPVEAITLAAAALLVVLFVAKRQGEEPMTAALEGTPAPIPAPEEVATSVPSQDPAAIGQGPDGQGQDRQQQVAQGTQPPNEASQGVIVADGSNVESQGLEQHTDPQVDTKRPATKPQTPKTGYDANNPFVPEWEQDASEPDKANATTTGSNEIAPTTAGTTTGSGAGAAQALSSGVSVQTAQYAFGVRVSSVSTLGELARGVEALGGRLVDGSGARIDPAALESGSRPSSIRLVVPPGQTEAVTALLSRYGAAPKKRPASTALFASDYVVFDLSVSYTDAK